jgi:hypothetical protein
MKRILVVIALATLGCSGRLVHVRMDVPVGARVNIPRGFQTPEINLATPLVAVFESGSMAIAGGYPLVFKLDADAAKTYGADHPVDIYARLNVNNPTDFSRTQTIRIPMSDEKLKALIRGEVSEISAYVEDPNEANRPKLAVITMRLARF